MFEMAAVMPLRFFQNISTNPRGPLNDFDPQEQLPYLQSSQTKSPVGQA